MLVRATRQATLQMRQAGDHQTKMKGVWSLQSRAADRQSVGCRIGAWDAGGMVSAMQQLHVPEQSTMPARLQPDCLENRLAYKASSR